MAYMRGDAYIWSDGQVVHIWLTHGKDPCLEASVWAEERTGHRKLSGVAIPQDLLDEYVVMRHAQLRRDGLEEEARRRALANHLGNAGCLALDEEERHRGEGDQHT